ncbi:MAG TPA: hypothetical protein VKO20_01135 [Desulfosalsimonadaceae bacterium]|nr:hypothetical protein [Desulfosalsimonadaceae bacterium]
MRKIMIPLIVMLLFVAVPAMAGQVHVTDDSMEWLNTSEEVARYAWEADIANDSVYPQEYELAISLHGQDGKTIDTVHHEAFIEPNQKMAINGFASVEGRTADTRPAEVDVEVESANVITR